MGNPETYVSGDPQELQEGETRGVQGGQGQLSGKVDSVARWGQNLCDCLKLLRRSTGRTGCEYWCCLHTQGLPVNSWLQHFSREDSSGRQ